MSLFKKLSEKLKEVSAKDALSEKLKKVSAKGAIGLVLASAIILAGCDFGANIELPNEKPNESENEHTLSQLTLDMLNDEYYQNLIEERKTDPNSTLYKFQPIPYGFIESEGYDNTVLPSTQLIYTNNQNGNDIYLNVRFHFQMTTPYYAYTTLKYTLTDEEMADFKYFNENNYYESALFIQNLSYKKEAEVIDNAKIVLGTKNRIDRYINGSEELNLNNGENQTNIEYQGYSDGLLYFNIYSYNLDKNSDNCTVRQIKLKPTEIDKVEFRYDDVCYYPYETTIASQEALDEYLNNYTTVTCYNPVGTNFLVDELNNENTK